MWKGYKLLAGKHEEAILWKFCWFKAVTNKLFLWKSMEEEDVYGTIVTTKLETTIVLGKASNSTWWQIWQRTGLYLICASRASGGERWHQERQILASWVSTSNPHHCLF